MRSAILAVVAFSAIAASFSQSAEAQSYGRIEVTYEVQVQYWFFDVEGAYAWNTVFESTNRSDAQLMYDLLLLAKENNQLNEVVPASYWRYIAVDVRMRSRLNYTNSPRDLRVMRPKVQYSRPTLLK